MGDHRTAFIGQRIRIKDDSDAFPGCTGVVVYIGEYGISVYLIDHRFDDPIALYDREWDEVKPEKVK